MRELIKKERTGLELEFVSHDELSSQLDKLLKEFGADISQADLEKTKKILSKVSSLSEELTTMRDED